MESRTQSPFAIGHWGNAPGGPELALPLFIAREISLINPCDRLRKDLIVGRALLGDRIPETPVGLVIRKHISQGYE